jgi:hypothetical protein
MARGSAHHPRRTKEAAELVQVVVVVVVVVVAVAVVVAVVQVGTVPRACGMMTMTTTQHGHYHQEVC